MLLVAMAKQDGNLKSCLGMMFFEKEPKQSGKFWPRYRSGEACGVRDGFGLGCLYRVETRWDFRRTKVASKLKSENNAAKSTPSKCTQPFWGQTAGGE